MQSIEAKINDEYNAQGQSLETLRDFHIGFAANKLGEHVSNYTLSFQVIKFFPIVMTIFFVLLFIHVFDKYDIYSIRNRLYINDKQKNNTKNHFGSAKPSTKNLWIMSMALTSFAFVIYVFVLDSIAVGYRRHLVEEEIFYNPTPGKDTSRTAIDEASNDIKDKETRRNFLLRLQIEYAIPITILCYDLAVLLFLVGYIVIIRCMPWAPKWHYILLGPLSCIAIHSYHIILGFIHNPEHAASIAVFYGIVVILFIVTLRVVYVTSFSLIYQCQRIQAAEINYLSKYDEEPKYNRCIKICWEWNCCFEWLKKRKCSGCLPYRWPHTLVLLILSIVSVFIAGFTVYVVTLYIINPVNMAIEGARNSLISINQTVLLFLGAAVTYKIVKDEKSTIISLLVKAMNKATKSVNEQQTEKKAANQLVQSAAKQKFQIAATNYFTVAVTNYIHAVGMDVETTAEEDRQGRPVANQEVQEAAQKIVHQSVRKFFQTLETTTCTLQEELKGTQPIVNAIQNLLQTMISLIQTVVRKEHQPEGQQPQPDQQQQQQQQPQVNRVITAVSRYLSQEPDTEIQKEIAEGIQSFNDKAFALVEAAVIEINKLVITKLSTQLQQAVSKVKQQLQGQLEEINPHDLSSHSSRIIKQQIKNQLVHAVARSLTLAVDSQQSQQTNNIFQESAHGLVQASAHNLYSVAQQDNNILFREVADKLLQDQSSQDHSQADWGIFANNPVVANTLRSEDKSTEEKHAAAKPIMEDIPSLDPVAGEGDIEAVVELMSMEDNLRK